MKKYEFDAKKVRERDYRVFCDELEDNPSIWFHGTGKEEAERIRNAGFKPPGTPETASVGNLASVSFAKRSSTALQYASKGTLDDPPSGGCIFVVEFETFDGVSREGDVIYVYRQDRMPKIIGYCCVPATYRHA
jgi:hypothetical protein